MSLDLSYLHKRLKNKGFKIEKGRRDFYCRFYIDGVIRTSISSKVGGHSKRKYKTLADSTIARIYRSLWFDNKNQFIEFLDCPFELEDYQRMLLEKGQIDIRH